MSKPFTNGYDSPTLPIIIPANDEPLRQIAETIAQQFSLTGCLPKIDQYGPIEDMSSTFGSFDLSNIQFTMLVDNITETTGVLLRHQLDYGTTESWYRVPIDNVQKMVLEILNEPTVATLEKCIEKGYITKNSSAIDIRICHVSICEPSPPAGDADKKPIVDLTSEPAVNVDNKPAVNADNKPVVNVVNKQAINDAINGPIHVQNKAILAAVLHVARVCNARLVSATLKNLGSYYANNYDNTSKNIDLFIEPNEIDNFVNCWNNEKAAALCTDIILLETLSNGKIYELRKYAVFDDFATLKKTKPSASLNNIVQMGTKYKVYNKTAFFNIECRHENRHVFKFIFTEQSLTLDDSWNPISTFPIDSSPEKALLNLATEKLTINYNCLIKEASKFNTIDQAIDKFVRHVEEMRARSFTKYKVYSGDTLLESLDRDSIQPIIKQMYDHLVSQNATTQYTLSDAKADIDTANKLIQQGSELLKKAMEYIK